MKNKSVIIKSKYNQNQGNDPIKLQKYTIIEENGVRFLVLEFKNEYKSRVNDATFMINEKLIGGNLEKEHTIKHIDIDPNGIYVSNKIKVQNDCQNITFHLLSATFEDVIYSRGTFTKIDKSFKNRFLSKKINKQKFSLSVLIFSLPIIALASILTYFGVKQYAFSKPVFNIEDFDYKFADSYNYDEYTPIVITKYHGDDKHIKIPNSIKQHRIESIDDGAFMDNKSIESIEFDDYIVLGNDVFKDCSSLYKIDFDDIVTYGDYCFYGTAINSYISNSIDYIPDYAFSNCYKLETVNITSKNVTMGENSFSNCKNLKTFDMISKFNLNDRNKNFLYNSPSLEKLHLENLNNFDSLGPLTIKDLIGQEAKKLEEIHIDNILYIPEFFASCLDNLTSVTIDNMRYHQIYDFGFDYCPKLENVNIPKVEYIGEDAFRGTKLNSFDLSNVTFIGKNAFSGTNIKIADLSSCKDIKEGAFKDCTLLQEADLPTTLKFIPNNLFSGCKSLKKIILPREVKEIHSNAFTNCSNLQYVYANEPSMIMSIGNYAFSGCKSLKSINIDEFINLKDLGSYAFASCSSLEEFDISNTNITFLNDGILKNCINLSKVYFPDKIITLPTFFFDGCKNLESISLAGFKRIGNYAFRDCESLKEIEFDEELANIGDGAFNNCISLTSLKLPKNIVHIGFNILYNCYNLTDLSVPFVGSSYKSTENFYYLFGANTLFPSLSSLEISHQSDIISNQFDMMQSLKTLIIGEDTIGFGYGWFNGLTYLENLTIPFIGFSKNSATTLLDFLNTSYFSLHLKTINITNATKIEFETFYNINTLKEITLNDEIESIGDGAFRYCRALESVKLPKNLKSISKELFRYCKSLSEIIVPENVISINDYAFSDCDKLKKVVISNSVKEIGDHVLQNDLALEYYKSPFIGKNPSDPNRRMTDLFGYNNTDVPLTIEITNEKEVPSYSLDYINELSKVILNEGVTKIGSYAFSGDYNLKEIVLPSTLKEIGDHAFADCYRLEELNLNEGLEKFDNALSNNYSLMKMTLPSTLNYFSAYYLRDTALFEIKNNSSIDLNSTSLGWLIQKGYINVRNNDSDPVTETYCENGLTYIERDGKAFLINSTNENEEVIIPETIKIGDKIFDEIEINKNCFNLDKNIKSVKFSPAVKTIPDSCFSQTKNLSSVDFGENSQISVIDNYSFSSCNSLTEIVIPDSVVSINEYAFNYDTNLEKITIGKNVTNIGYNAFNYCDNLVEIFNLSSLKIDNTIDNGKIGQNALVIHNSLDDDPFEKVEIGDFLFGAYKDQCFLLKYNSNDNSSVVLPDSVSINDKIYTNYSIERRAFYCSQGNTIYIPDAVDEIKKEAFYNSRFQNVEFGENSNLESIGESAFESSYNLKEIALPNNLKTIENSAFRYCDLLNKVVLGENLETIGNNAFSSCKNLLLVVNLSNLEIEKGSSDFGEVAHNALAVTDDVNATIKNQSINNYQVQIIGDNLIVTSLPYLNIDRKLVLPDEFVDAGKVYDSYYLKSGCINYSIRELVIPDSVLDIPSYLCSYSNNSLYKLTIMPNPNITVIKSNSLSNLHSLSEIVIPEGIVEIESNAFYNTALERVTLPSTLKKVGSNAFTGHCKITELINHSSLNFVKGDYNDLSGLSENLVTLTDTKLDEIELIDYNDDLYKIVNNEYYYRCHLDYCESQFALPKGIYSKDKLISETYRVDFLYNENNNYIKKLYIPKQVIGLADDTFDTLYDCKDIYYEGTKEEFIKIFNNVDSIEANIHYEYSWKIENGRVVEVIKNA